jgi:hypothetical protein
MLDISLSLDFQPILSYILSFFGVKLLDLSEIAEL